MAPIRWTPEEDAMMRELYPLMSNIELANVINEHCGNGRTDKAVTSHARTLGLHKPKGFKRSCKKTFWTDDKREWFVSYVPGHTESEISAEHERIYGTPLTESQISNAKHVLGVKSGTKGGQFKKGHAPSNKGKKWADFMSDEGQERSRAGWFKKGEVHDRPDGWIKPIGFERVSNDGYIEVKVKDSRIHGIQPNTKGNFNRNYRMKHHVVWEEAHGKIPPHTNIVFADGNKRNFDIDNLVAVPRAYWKYICQEHLEYYDRESLEACMNIAKVRMAANAMKMRPRKCGVCGQSFSPRFSHQRTCDGCLDKGLRSHRKKKHQAKEMEGTHE